MEHLNPAEKCIGESVMNIAVAVAAIVRASAQIKNPFSEYIFRPPVQRELYTARNDRREEFLGR